MKIRNFTIKNFKSLENVSINDCSDFHALIGANSAGKTSVFDALNIIKIIQKNFQNPEMVTNGISDYETKNILVDMTIELDDDECRNYLVHAFHIVESKIDYLLEKKVLSKIHLQIMIMIHGSKVSNTTGHRHVFPSLLQIHTEVGYVNLIESNQENFTVNLRQDFAQNNELKDTSFGDYINRTGFGGGVINRDDYRYEGSFVGRFLLDLIENLRYVEAIRETHKKVKIQFLENESDIGQRGEQLSNFMDTLWTNKHERYLEIEKYCKAIFPNIEKIRPEKLPNNEIIIKIYKKNIDEAIPLDNDGRGIDQALVIIWRIATSPKNTIWLIDEPEIHLHPGAQKLLYEFLQDEISRGKQIIVSTHSMVFIHRCKEEQISILLYKDGITELSSLQNLVNVEIIEGVEREHTRDIVYDALGYDSSQSLEYTTIVAVEGKTDEKIFKIFADVLGKSIDTKLVKFVPVGNKNDAKRFAPILKFTVSKKMIIILDNDNQNPKELKQSIQNQENEYKKKIGLQKSLLKDDEFCFYDEDMYSIESYLLDADAIVKAGNLDKNKIEEIKKRIITEQTKPKIEREKPKNLLSNIWSDFGLGNYDDESPEKIAKNMSKLSLLKFPEISEIIDKINGNYSAQ